VALCQNEEFEYLKVAVVHDYLVSRGGAEGFVLSLLRAFPDAQLYTSFYRPDTTFNEFRSYDVQTSFLQSFPIGSTKFRSLLPLYPYAFRSLRIAADIVLCSTSGWAHGVRSSGKKILFVHNTARWLYQQDDYFGNSTQLRWLFNHSLYSGLRAWDGDAGRSANGILVSSRGVQRRVRDYWCQPSALMYHPIRHGLDEEICPLALEPGFLLVVGRLMAYKHVNVLLAAMRLLNDRFLVVVGEGPEEARLRSIAPSNVLFMPSVSAGELRWLYTNASALLAASYEDYGLTPIEAMRYGTPVVALRSGGYLETVVEGRTGVFFDSLRPEDIASAVDSVVTNSWDAEGIRAYSMVYSDSDFSHRCRDAVELMLGNDSPTAWIEQIETNEQARLSAARARLEGRRH
jgi:glycosyltransferase involved in cell wall biosynthesis